jgi:PAS domain S-box-containing protein
MDKNGIFLGCNRSFDLIVGLAKEEIIGKDAYAILPKNLADTNAAADLQVFASSQAHTYETVIRDVQGAERSVIVSKAVFYREDGSLGGLTGTIIDISEFKRIEVEKTLLVAAIEQTPEMVIITDPDGRISYANPAFERISGYNRKHAIGRSTAILQSGHQSKEFYSGLWQKLKDKKNWSGRLTNRRKDGSLYEVEATIVPVQNPDGQVTNYLAVERDISQEIVREKQLRQAQKMEAIGTLAGGIAHDFNNILSAILGFTEIAMCDLDPQAPPSLYLSKVLPAGERARDLVNQILAFSRSTEQEMRPVRAQAIVKEALKLLQATLPSTIRITSRMESSAAIMADPTQIHQLIINLCTNAAHAMQDSGGELHVSMMDKPLEQAALQHHGDLLPGEYLHISVSDTGCGIAQDIIDRIFDPFFTTKKQGEGTGMGLSVVHGIVRGCNGFIQVHSTPGKGTLFEILLPVIKTGQVSVPDRDLDLPLPLGSGHILFVDDEPFQVELGQQMLQRLGYQVTALNDNLLALAHFRQAPQAFDLLITDMTMPNMTGDQLASHFMAIRPDMPVIICTGYSQKLAEIKTQPANISRIAYKPLVMRDLANLVRSVLEKKQNG